MASQRQHPIGKWPTRKDRQLAWALPSRKRVGSPIQPPRRPLQVVHEPAERSSQQHGLPPAKRRRRESINSHRQASYYSQQQDATHDSDDHDNFDDLDVSDDEVHTTAHFPGLISC